MLIPKGYKTIAVRDDRKGNCVISYNPTARLYFLSINGIGAGPFTLPDLSQMVENMKDVISLRGIYIFNEDYNPDGSSNLD